MPIEMQKGLSLKPGPHTGTLQNPRIKPGVKKSTGEVKGNYLEYDVLVDVPEGDPQKVNLSMPAHYTPASQLGRFGAGMGIPYEVGAVFNEAELEGVRVSFELEPDGPFVRPVPHSFRRLSES